MKIEIYEPAMSRQALADPKLTTIFVVGGVN